jgi:3-deoxy-D-manno-octulosonic-acid transferase
MYLPYTLLLLLVYPLLRFIALFHSRLAENFALRSRVPDFSAARGKMHIWFHAASAGEFEQARAVAHELKRVHKNVFLSFSFFSDSAYRAKKNDPLPDRLFALPFDFPWRMRALLAAMQPAALIIAKYDAWPNQVRAAVRAGVKVYLVSATLPEKSLRWRFPLKFLLRPVYSAMRAVFSINTQHAERLKKISPHNIVVSGDTRFDAIALRLAADRTCASQVMKLKSQLRGRLVLVAGSTYFESEQMLIEYLGLRPRPLEKKLCAVIAPHQVQPQRIAEIEGLAKKNGLKSLRWSEWVKRGVLRHKRTDFDVLVIDALGILPHLYPLAQVAYVGGGFRGSVHSVIEPVIAGVPVITGPAIHNSAEAEELSAMGLLSVLPALSAQKFRDAVENLARKKRGLRRKLKAYFRERVGASRQIVHTVMDDILTN